MTNTMKVDLVVVGGGLGGLITAVQARRAGRSVVVLEQAATAGGLGRSPKLGEREMNFGPHALYLGGPAERTLEALGVTLPGFTPGGAAFLELDGALVPMPSSPLALLTAGWLSWRERVELGLVLRRLSGPAPTGSVRAWLETLRSPRVRQFVELMVRLTTYVNAPELLSTKLAWRQLRTLLDRRARGVRYLDGGWQALVDALSAQVEVRFGARVREVSGRVVRLESGEVLEGAEVALAVPLAAAAKLVNDAALQARLASSSPVRAACLDVVLTQLPDPTRRLVLGMAEPTYFSVHSRPQLHEHVKVHVAWYLRPDDVTDAAELRARLERFLERVQPGWRSLSEGERFFPHLRVMDDVPREQVTRLEPPQRLVSPVATDAFLFDAVVESSAPSDGAMLARSR